MDKDRIEKFRDTYSAVEEDVRQIVATVQSIPVEKRPGTAHIDYLSAITQYVFYISIIRQWLTDPQSKILDWGGQHGQVTRLLSRFYPNTTCYALANDAYDQRYGLSEWHRRLDIVNIVRSSDPLRLVVPDESFDAVISSGVLEHVGEVAVDESDALSELYRSLKPSGFLFIWNLPRKFGREYLYPLFRRTAHQRRYRKKEIIGMLRNAGFSISYFGCHELLPLSILKRLEGVFSPYTLLRYDYATAEYFSFLAQNFTIVAQKRAPSR